MDTPEGRDAHATTMQKMLDSAHPVAFDMTFIAMKLQQIDDIGVHGYNLEGTPTHPQKRWYDRKQDGTYNPNPDGSLTAGKTKLEPRLHPQQLFMLEGGVIMTFDKYVEDQLKYDSGLQQKYTQLEKQEHDRKVKHGKLSLMLQNGHTRGGVFKDTMTSNDFVAGYLNTTKSCSGTAEACFEYIREGSGDNRSDLQTVVRNICKGSLQSQKWIAQQIRRAQTDGMSGSRREVTHCRVPIPPNGLFVFDGINMLDKNVHPKRRMMHALQAFGAKTFDQFDANVADIKAKLNRQKDIAKGIEAHPLSLWSFVCNMHSGKPKKQTVRDSTNSFATDVAFNMAQQIRIAAKTSTSASPTSWKPHPRLNAKHATSCSNSTAACGRCSPRSTSSCANATLFARFRRRARRPSKSKRRRKGSTRSRRTSLSPVMEPFCEPGEAVQGKGAQNAVRYERPAAPRRCRQVRAAGPARRAFRARPTAPSSIVSPTPSSRISTHPPSWAAFYLRGKDVCACSLKGPLNPNQPNSPLVNVPFNAALALKTLADYEAADETQRAPCGKREQALNDVLHNTEVLFEDPNEYADAYDGVTRNAPAWEPCSVILMNVYDVAVKVTKDIIENNDSLRNSKPTRNMRNYERHAQGLINAMRIAPVYADSSQVLPNGNRHQEARPHGAQQKRRQHEALRQKR